MNSGLFSLKIKIHIFEIDIYVVPYNTLMVSNWFFVVELWNKADIRSFVFVTISLNMHTSIDCTVCINYYRQNSIMMLYIFN